MKINWNYIKFIGLIICITGLYAFSSHRSDSRTVQGMNLKFTGENNLYITQSMVNKLLIQNYGIVINMPKEKLDLDTIEKVIEANEMVKSAQVYLTITGELTSNIVQRQPIGRVEGKTKFYLDEDGKNILELWDKRHLTLSLWIENICGGKTHLIADDRCPEFHRCEYQSGNQAEDKSKAVTEMYSLIDTQARKGLMPKSRASRLKSRIAAAAIK